MRRTNLVGVLETVRVFLPALKRAGGADLVLLSSLGARVTFPGYAVYGATKAAVSYLAEAWRGELAPPGMRVTAIEPGLTHSELAGNVTHAGQADELAGMFDQIPALSAEEVADLVAYAVALPAHASLPGCRSFPPVKREPHAATRSPRAWPVGRQRRIRQANTSAPIPSSAMNAIVGHCHGSGR